MPMATRVDEASQVEQYSDCQRPTLHGTEPCIFEVKNTGPSPEFDHCTQLPNSNQCDTTWADFQACHSEPQAKNPEGLRVFTQLQGGRLCTRESACVRARIHPCRQGSCMMSGFR